MACAPSFNTTSAKTHKPRTKPFSIRLTDDEKRLLEARAGRTPLGAFIRSLILAEGDRANRQRAVSTVKDHIALARVLAQLGRSQIAESLVDLAKAARIGALPGAPETHAALRDACEAVISMRCDLVRALGLSDGCGS